MNSYEHKLSVITSFVNQLSDLAYTMEKSEDLKDVLEHVSQAIVSLRASRSCLRKLQESPINLYEVVFSGTIGKERKVYKHSFPVLARHVESHITGEILNDGLLRQIVSEVLAVENARVGEWSLETFQAKSEPYTSPEGGKLGYYEVSASRQILASGKL